MKKTILLLMLLVVGTQVKAQIDILQNTINKLVSYKNFSYENVYKQKEVFSDTLTSHSKIVLLKAPENKELGYLFKQESIDDKGKLLFAEMYNGKDVVSIRPLDSVYNVRKNQASVFEGLLIADLNWMKDFSMKKPSQIIQSTDTVYHSINSYHLILSTSDTIINNDHHYVRIHLIIDKATGLPIGRFTRSRNTSFGKEPTNYYTENRYWNYKIDQADITSNIFATPPGYHLPIQKPKEETTLLKNGTTAPDWTLYDTDGKKTSLTDLKGKIVLLDFFFVGCVPCMNTLEPLDKLHAKYKNKDVVILSISDRDNKKLVTAFKKAQKIKNQMYPDGNDVAKQYHVKEAPVFYFVDKQGKIASVVVGYEEGFEKKMTGIIESLIKS